MRDFSLFQNHTFSTFFEQKLLAQKGTIRMIFVLFERWMNRKMYYSYDFETQKNLSQKQSVLFYGLARIFDRVHPVIERMSLRHKDGPL